MGRILAEEWILAEGREFEKKPVAYFERTTRLHRNSAVTPFPQDSGGPGQPEEPGRGLTEYRHSGAAEIQRKLAASTEDQLPAAGLAMETLTIGRETAIKLYCEKISFTVKSEMTPSIMLKSYYACCT